VADPKSLADSRGERLRETGFCGSSERHCSDAGCGYLFPEFVVEFQGEDAAVIVPASVDKKLSTVSGHRPVSSTTSRCVLIGDVHSIRLGLQ
jgi:hypothetical protein